MLLSRMIRAAKLDAGLYDEVGRDQSATAQALAVVLVAAVAGGIGSALAGYLSPLRINPTGSAFLVEAASVLLGWAVLSLSIYVVGTALFGGKATLGQVLRTTGFASSPLVLSALVFLPTLGLLVAVVSLVWGVIAMVAGIRQTFGFGTGRAVSLSMVSLVALLAPAALLARIALAFGFFG